MQSKEILDVQRCKIKFCRKFFLVFFYRSMEPARALFWDCLRIYLNSNGDNFYYAVYCEHQQIKYQIVPICIAQRNIDLFGRKKQVASKKLT